LRRLRSSSTPRGRARIQMPRTRRVTMDDQARHRK
jgi:hypothetical protein